MWGVPAPPWCGHPRRAGGTRNTLGRAQEKAVPQGAGGGSLKAVLPGRGDRQTGSRTDRQTDTAGWGVSRQARRRGGIGTGGVGEGRGLVHPGGPRGRGGSAGPPPGQRTLRVLPRLGQARAGQLLARVRPPPNRLRFAPPPSSGRAPPRQTHANPPPPAPGRQHPRGAPGVPGAPQSPAHSTHACTHTPQSCWGVGGAVGHSPTGCRARCAGTGWGGGCTAGRDPPTTTTSSGVPPAAGGQTAPWRSGGTWRGRQARAG